jgi:hypothetical protein
MRVKVLCIGDARCDVSSSKLQNHFGLRFDADLIRYGCAYGDVQSDPRGEVLHNDGDGSLLPCALEEPDRKINGNANV